MALLPNCRDFGDVSPEVCSIPFSHPHQHFINDAGDLDFRITGPVPENADPTSDEDIPTGATCVVCGSEDVISELTPNDFRCILHKLVIPLV